VAIVRFGNVGHGYQTRICVFGFPVSLARQNTDRYRTLSNEPRRQSPAGTDTDTDTANQPTSLVVAVGRRRVAAAVVLSTPPSPARPVGAGADLGNGLLDVRIQHRRPTHEFRYRVFDDRSQHVVFSYHEAYLERASRAVVSVGRLSEPLGFGIDVIHQQANAVVRVPRSIVAAARSDVFGEKDLLNVWAAVSSPGVVVVVVVGTDVPGEFDARIAPVEPCQEAGRFFRGESKAGADVPPVTPPAAVVVVLVVVAATGGPFQEQPAALSGVQDHHAAGKHAEFR